jgi:hypothetical protein
MDGGIPPLFLTLAVDGVSGQLHAPASLAHPRKGPLIQLDGPRTSLNVVEKRKFFILLGFEPWHSSP